MTNVNRANVHVLLATTAMTPTERAQGRFLRAPEGHTDYEGFASPEGTGTPPADSGSNVDNQGNSGDSNKDGGTGNNTGQPDLGAGFWETKPEVDTSGDESDKAASTQLGQELSGMIAAFQTPPVFTKETAEKIASGDLEGVNKAFQDQSQSMLRQATVVAAKIVETMMARQEASFEQRIQKALGNKDNSVALETHFPAAKNPAYRPIVQRVFDQSLVNAKGDTAKAVELTKSMLKAFGTDAGIGTPPSDVNSVNESSRSRSLVDELLGRDDKRS